MVTEYSLKQLINKLDKLPDNIQKNVIKTAANTAKASIQDRVVTSGKDASGKVMRYSPSTKMYKQKTGRQSSFKVLSHLRNRIWSAYQVKLRKYSAEIGWRKGSEAYALAQHNQTRQVFNAIGPREERAMERQIKKVITKNFRDWGRK